MTITATIALRLIRVYQRTFSYDHGPFSYLFPYGYCRFSPTCSEYTYQAIAKYGAVRGIGKGLKRIVRCHPFHQCGFDPLT